MDEQQEALKRIHDKMIFDCLNEALDGKRVLGLKGCPLPVDLISLFNQLSLGKEKQSFKKIKDCEMMSKSSNRNTQFWKSLNSKSDNNLTENSGKLSLLKTGISRSQRRQSNLEENKENQVENNSLTSYKLFLHKKQNKEPLSKIFEKTAEQIKKWALFMCGMYDHKPENFKYFPEIINPLILERIKESRMTLLEMSEMEELGQKMNDYDDEKYEITLNLNDLIWENLILDLCSDLVTLENQKTSNFKKSLQKEIKINRSSELLKFTKPDIPPLNSGIKIGSGETSNMIPTEDALTKLDYFPNYSYTRTDKSENSNYIISDSLINGNVIQKEKTSNSEKYHNGKFIIYNIIFRIIRK